MTGLQGYNLVKKFTSKLKVAKWKRKQEARNIPEKTLWVTEKQLLLHNSHKEWRTLELGEEGHATYELEERLLLQSKGAKRLGSEDLCLRHWSTTSVILGRSDV